MMGRKGAILVLRHNGLGDLMTGIPAMRALRRTYPTQKIIMTCPSWLKDLAGYLNLCDLILSDRSNPDTIGPTDHRAADSNVLASVLELKERVELIVSLRTPGHELLPLLRALRPSQILSYRHPAIPETSSAPFLDFADHIFSRWARLLGLLGIDLDANDLFLRTPRPLDRNAPVILHAGAGSPARLWPQDRWTEVARKVQAMGWKLQLTGTLRERDRALTIANQAGVDVTSVSLNTTACDLLHRVAAAGLVLSVDSGVAHLATATRTSAVTLFGPVSPGCWGPPKTCTEHITIWKGQEHNPYGETIDPGLEAITTKDVVNAFAKATSQNQNANHVN